MSGCNFPLVFTCLDRLYVEVLRNWSHMQSYAYGRSAAIAHVVIIPLSLHAFVLCFYPEITTTVCSSTIISPRKSKHTTRGVISSIIIADNMDGNTMTTSRGIYFVRYLVGDNRCGFLFTCNWSSSLSSWLSRRREYERSRSSVWTIWVFPPLKYTGDHI